MNLITENNPNYDKVAEEQYLIDMLKQEIPKQVRDYRRGSVILNPNLVSGQVHFRLWGRKAPRIYSIHSTADCSS
jgi:hypothetical protein